MRECNSSLLKLLSILFLSLSLSLVLLPCHDSHSLASRSCRKKEQGDISTSWSILGQNREERTEKREHGRIAGNILAVSGEKKCQVESGSLLSLIPFVFDLYILPHSLSSVSSSQQLCTTTSCLIPWFLHPCFAGRQVEGEMFIPILCKIDMLLPLALVFTCITTWKEGREFESKKMERTCLSLFQWF